MRFSVVHSLVNGLLDLIFPRLCLLCRSPLDPSEPKGNLCPCCARRIEYNHPSFCEKCSRPVMAGRDPLCRSCRHRALFFDRCWGAVIYNDTMRILLHLFKYGKHTELRRDFSRMMIAFVKKYSIPVHDCDLIIPVPLHRTRFRERGFNQSGLIALLLAREFQIPCDTTIIRRVRHTVNQARVNSKQRWTNIQGTFTIKHPDIIINKNILLVDDLLTTGATLSEISLELKKAGAGSVYGLTTAIAVLKAP